MSTNMSVHDNSLTSKATTSFTAIDYTLRLAAPVQHDCCLACRRRPAPRSTGTTTTLLALR